MCWGVIGMRFHVRTRPEIRTVRKGEPVKLITLIVMCTLLNYQAIIKNLKLSHRRTAINSSKNPLARSRNVYKRKKDSTANLMAMRTTLTQGNAAIRTRVRENLTK